MKDKMKLVIGDQNLSSWSMRPWLVLKEAGIPFQEIKIRLDTPTSQKQIRKYSNAGRVPVLLHGKVRVWDSLAICEYIAELAPECELLPRNASHRAIARSLVAEMHSGFSALRSELSMDLSLRIRKDHLSPATVRDIERVLHIWHHSVKTNGGPFLFGRKFGIIDAFYAPVVLRFQSYGIEVKDPWCQKFMKGILAHPAVQEWVAGAKKEKPVRRVFR